eukprot:SAG31_NODE_796_length_12032_cov_21.073242_17_plen_67_part_00
MHVDVGDYIERAFASFDNRAPPRRTHYFLKTLFRMFRHTKFKSKLVPYREFFFKLGCSQGRAIRGS